MKFIKVIATKATNLFTKAVCFVASALEKVIDMAAEKHSFKAKVKTGEVECEIEVGSRTWYAATGIILAGAGAYSAVKGCDKIAAALVAVSASVMLVGAYAHFHGHKTTLNGGMDAAHDMRKDAGVA